MEQKEFDNMMCKWLKQQENMPASGDKKIDWAVRSGITDGQRPQSFVTREETVELIYRALDYFFQQLIFILGKE